MNIDLTPVIPYGTQPREWQTEFLTSLQKGVIKFAVDQTQKDKSERLPYVLNAFPGTGKTYASLLAANYMLHTGIVEHVIKIDTACHCIECPRPHWFLQTMFHHIFAKLAYTRTLVSIQTYWLHIR